MTAQKATVGNGVTVIVSIYKRKKLTAKYTVTRPAEVRKYLVEYERRQLK